jgi:hypothetical protein
MPSPTFGLSSDKWHQDFYLKLRRNDGGLCCNLMDCRPTQSRMVGDHYEVKVDGEWMAVPNDKITVVMAVTSQFPPPLAKLSLPMAG